MNRVATSDSEGRFVFRDVPPGSYTLRATGAALNRFRNGAASVTVPGGQRTVTVDVQLESLPPCEETSPSDFSGKSVHDAT